jgi:hypothetical protein
VLINFCCEKIIIGFVSLVIFASSPLRHAFYETFLHVHILLALMTFITLWYHLEDKPQQNYLLAALVLWAAEVSFDISNVMRG